MIQELTQEILNLAKSVLTDIHTALPCKIQSIDFTRCTASVQPVGTFRVSGKELDYPVITEVPIVLPCSQNGTGIVFPIKVGDSALLVISETELDEWRTGSKSQGALRFDLTNSMCIPGLLKEPLPFLKEANESDSVIISSGTSKISIGGSGIVIHGNVVVKGSVNTSGDIVSGGVSLQNHSH